MLPAPLTALGSSARWTAQPLTPGHLHAVHDAALTVARTGSGALPSGQGWHEVGELALAFGLSAVLGLEREIRLKNAGLRTQTLVGVGAALFVLLSKYGFSDVLTPGRIVLDPSRVAAQIVTGIGFLGAGVIFVNRGSVHGLTTAAVIWLTAAVGAAAGAGLGVLAATTVGLYVVVSMGFPVIERILPRAPRAPGQDLQPRHDHPDDSASRSAS
jgi:putative Mg2+ transporter-C (MgtC) family protein